MNKHSHFILFAGFLLAAGLLLTGCSTDEPLNTGGDNVLWMRVLDEQISGSTEDDGLLGQNGKVIAAPDDSLYLYYYSEMHKQVVVMKLSPDGIPVWKRVIGNCIPTDMVLRPDGHLALALRDYPGSEDRLEIMDFSPNGDTTAYRILHITYGGTNRVLSASMTALPDNGLAISGVYLTSAFLGSPLSKTAYLLLLDAGYSKINNIAPLLGFLGNKQAGQSSIVSVGNGLFLAQFSYTADPTQGDLLEYGYQTMVMRQDTDRLVSTHTYPTGFFRQSDGTYGGHYSRYCNGLIPDGGSNIHYYSAPAPAKAGAAVTVQVPNGFLRIDDDGLITDTLPLSLPTGYRMLSLTKGPAGFLITAYKTGGVDVISDFGASQTLFLTGDNFWQATGSFHFQDFYTDLFASAAATSDGGYVLMGKIQSFNGTANKLILIKWNQR